MRACFFAFALSALLVLPVHAQGIVTADQFLQRVSAHYASIRDYEANLAIRSGNVVMNGTVIHASPSMLRMDFTQPANQVIVFNENTLTVFLPDLREALVQPVSESRMAGANMASAEGLNMLRRYYISTFVTSPDPVPLYANSQERVVKLRLTRRAAAEGFREIILSVNPETNLIRRIVGTTIAGVNVQFDFTDTRINQGIPASRFVYTPPAGTVTRNNFMFRN